MTIATATPRVEFFNQKMKEVEFLEELREWYVGLVNCKMVEGNDKSIFTAILHLVASLI